MNRENVVIHLDEKKYMHRDDKLIILLRHVLRTPTYSFKGYIGGKHPNESNFFRYPCDVVIDERRSLLFVSDCGELNIQVFDLLSREFLYNIKTLDRPRFLAIYCDSLIFSSEDGFVYRYDLETRNEIWKSSVTMKNPCGVIVDEMRGLVYVCECGAHAINILSADTGKAKSVISLGARKSSLFSYKNTDTTPMVTNPYGIAFSMDNNNLVVSSIVDCQVHLIDRKGKVVNSFGQPGTKPNQFNFPSSLIVDKNNGNILICDRNNNRISVFTSGGSFLKSFGNDVGRERTEALYQPRGLCIDHATGDLYVTDYGQDRICVYSQFN